jgi:Na+-transporting methylmalonyl-CoA/oxaloacetate decarboxylase gamma subunit
VTESFSFVLLASGVGMGIVFIFLAALSLIMAAIRGLDEATGRVGHERAERPPRTDVESAGGESRTYVPGHPALVIAAVSAYLDAERDEDSHSARVWTSRPERG